ncbi:MAG: hypothetical protein FJX80_12910 [Bacteroidetes bacterium]|nr:hypothetical protein [Bacteroidota bacterium]
MSKNSLGLLVVLLITVAVVTYWSLIDGGLPPEEKLEEVNDPRAKALISLSDSIERISWHSGIKDTFINMSVVLNLLLDEGVIETNTFEGLRKKINISYSSSLQRAFEDWKHNCNQSNYAILKSELLKLYSEPECRTNLSSAVSDIRKYDQILGFQSKLGPYIKSVYDAQEFSKLKDQIQSFKTYFSCSGVLSILRGYDNALDDQKKYYEAFEKIDYYDRNEEPENVKELVKNLCGDVSLRQYSAYYNKFSVYNSKYSVCNYN